MRDFLNLIFTELGKVERVSVLTYLEFCIDYVSLEVRVKTLFMSPRVQVCFDPFLLQEVAC